MLTTIKSLVHRVARSFGYDITRYPPGGSLLRELQLLLAELEITCVLDVGAHHGETGLKLRGLGYDGHIVSFEPLSESFRVLAAQSARDPKWKAYQMALGAVEGPAPINVLTPTVLSSLLPPTEAAREFPFNMRVQRTEVVEVRRLDHVWDECTAGMRSPAIFLKTDTQGSDLQVIRGASERLGEVRGLLVELAIRPLYRNVTPFADALAYLRNLGFEITAFEALGRDSSKCVLELDCLMRRVSNDR
ncbi:MAG TPA: FkbM family methyltransferase [Gemmatimonadales bacterium]